MGERERREERERGERRERERASERQSNRRTNNTETESKRAKKNRTRILANCWWLYIRAEGAALTDASFSIIQKLVALPTGTLGLPFLSHCTELVTAKGVLVARISFTCKT